MSIDDEQREFFLDLYRKHGDDPRSLSHRDGVTQRERYRRAARGFDEERPFSVHEVGCGLGHFGEYLNARHPRATYSGSEICEEFVEACRQRFPDGSFELRDLSGGPGEDRYDYLVLIGVFNIRAGRDESDWQRFVRDMLKNMYTMCRAGIVADFLTPYHDPEYTKAELHYQEVGALLDFVHAELSRHYEIDAGGPLYEYSLRVWRPEYLRDRFGAAEFDRYFKV